MLLGRKLRGVEGGGLMFRCPGCNENHMVRHGVGPGPRWLYNDNPDAPTFTPSILVQGKKLLKDAQGNWTGEWVRDGDGEPVPYICHSFVVEGRIQFLSDCTHALAGQTVDLPDWEPVQ